MKLQINANGKGAWRNVVEFDAAKRTAVLAAVVPLARALEGDARFCLVDDAGKRQWLGTLADAKSHNEGR